MARILLIDDSEIVREKFEDELLELGYEIQTAEGGSEGLKIFYDALHERESTFDLIITDITMPELSGIDVLAHVQKRSPETPVIMLSSNTEMKIVRQALREGAFDYVIKDEGIEPLQEAIASALEKVDASRTTPSVGADIVATLKDLVEMGADGEFIARAQEWEIHIHLQEGKVAWATSSTSKYAFTRHLNEHFGIDSEAIRTVVEECRKTRRPVGETLIEWGVATEDQIRTSLKAQIAQAMSALCQGTDTETIFLARESTYAQPLVFDLEELLPGT